MDGVLIRDARREDAPEMMRLIRELAAFERAPEQVSVQMDHFVESGFGERPVWWAIVAEDTRSARIVGMALYYIRYSTWKGQRMYLEDIIVEQSARRQGLGRKLMTRLTEIACERKWDAIHWQVLDWNEDAINFYRQFPVSFDAEWVNVRLDLKT